MFYSSFRDDIIASEAANQIPRATKTSIPKIKTVELNPGAEPKNAEDVKKESEKREKHEEKTFSMSSLLDKIIDAISQLLERTDTKINIILDKDSNFIKDYTRVKNTSKPLPSVELTNYVYDDEPARVARIAIKAYVNKAFNDFNGVVYGSKLSSDAIVEGSEQEFVEKFLKDMRPVAGSNVKDFNQYAKWLRARCKGDLKKVTATADKIPSYESIAFLKNQALKMQTRQDKALANKASTTIKANLRLISSNKNLSEETRKRAELYINRVNTLLDWYRTIIEIYYDIKIDKVCTARVVLRKLYKMQRQ